MTLMIPFHKLKDLMFKGKKVTVEIDDQLRSCGESHGIVYLEFRNGLTVYGREELFEKDHVKVRTHG